MSWSPQQEDGLKAVKAWLRAPRAPQVFRLFGYAGTGKSTLARTIGQEIQRGYVLYGAFTGKASLVMQRKGCPGASTIHRMIYRPVGAENGKEEEQPRFVINEESPAHGASLIIIDECSMVDEQLGKDLLSFGVKVLVLGDPAQLPPVKGAGFFTEATPDVMLTEVHRQAAENPIIALSMRIRNGDLLPLGDYGEARVITRDSIQVDDILKVDQVIVGLNKTRQSYNKRIRELLGRRGPMPEPSDKLVCLRNDRELRLLNGGLWKFDRYSDQREKKEFIRFLVASEDEEDGDLRKVRVRKEFFDGTDDKLEWGEKRGSQEFAYGYALTAHKSQGSQWPNITVFDEASSFREDAKRWRYTAITRAAERLTLVVPKGD